MANSSIISSALSTAAKTLEDFSNSQENIDLVSSAIDIFSDSLKNGGKLISCGNGGSMCDAMHFAEELTGRFREDREPMAAMAIGDSSHISCVANDYGFDQIFARPVKALGKKEDTLLAISTSGNSPNVIAAVEAAKASGMKVVALLGKDGGKLKDMVDIPLVVPAKTSDRIQEIHIKLIHIFIEGIEANCP